MKHKEKVHLKADPLAHFLEKVIYFFQNNRKQFFLGLVALLGIAAVLVAFLLIQSGTHARNNRIFTQALKIKSDTTLTLQEKVDRLKKLGKGKGLAGLTVLYTAQAYYENQQWQNALDTLKGFKTSSYPAINDNKRLLEAEVLRALGNKKEAVAVLQGMLGDAKTEIGKDYLLLKLAKIKLADGETEAAFGLLRQLQADFPDSALTTEAQTLLGEGEQN